MLVFVSLDERTQHIHQRSKRMIFVLADFVRDTVEQLHEFPIVFVCEARARPER